MNIDSNQGYKLIIRGYILEDAFISLKKKNVVTLKLYNRHTYKIYLKKKMRTIIFYLMLSLIIFDLVFAKDTRQKRSPSDVTEDATLSGVR